MKYHLPENFLDLMMYSVIKKTNLAELHDIVFHTNVYHKKTTVEKYCSKSTIFRTSFKSYGANIQLDFYKRFWGDLLRPPPAVAVGGEEGSPLFRGSKGKQAVKVDDEPQSPKVTCVGQIPPSRALVRPSSSAASFPSSSSRSTSASPPTWCPRTNRQGTNGQDWPLDETRWRSSSQKPRSKKATKVAAKPGKGSDVGEGGRSWITVVEEIERLHEQRKW
ncbi:hypothetical protein GUJ93_ZPchr0006g45188 [Zizania palustris]|uniref:Uncharacterized protein n=1 Tax=Zizania palustris TaxID=103762 RepID=A0A8J5T7A3_ZIZPA|nr:hypothetical protein GUJ93_ZPchr0006g45188 [Zizania palustris]